MVLEVDNEARFADGDWREEREVSRKQKYDAQYLKIMAKAGYPVPLWVMMSRYHRTKKVSIYHEFGLNLQTEVSMTTIFGNGADQERVEEEVTLSHMLGFYSAMRGRLTNYINSEWRVDVGMIVENDGGASELVVVRHASDEEIEKRKEEEDKKIVEDRLSGIEKGIF